MRCHLILIIPLLTIIWSCAQDITTQNVGRLTKPESRVDISAGGPYEARWQTLDIALNFEYQWEGERFDIRGNVELQKRIRGFTTLDHLRIRAHFLDVEGVILSTHYLWNAANNTRHPPEQR